MSRANFSVYSSTGSQPHPPYDDLDDTSHASEYDDHPHDQTSYTSPSSPESDISANDSASVSAAAARASSHARYQSHHHPQPPYPPSHERSHRQRPLRKTSHRRPPADRYYHPEPNSHDAYPEHSSTPSDPSELSASVAHQYDRPGYSTRASYHEGQHDGPYSDYYWPAQHPHYQTPMSASTSSTSHYSNPNALAPYGHYYPDQAYPYAGQASPGNPFMTAPLPHAPSPAPGYGYETHAQAYQLQRPEMLPRSSAGYLPAEMQYTAYPPRPYSVPQNMIQGMMPSPYHPYPHAPPFAPEEKPAPQEKKEEPPAAPPAPPPPTAEEIKKRMEEEAKVQAENLVNALKALQLEEKAAAAAAAEKDQKVQAESDKIALLLANFEKDRLAREEAAAAKAAAEKAEAEAKAAREKELADAATAARESAVKEAANAAAIAKAENEKAIAEAKVEHEKKMAEAKAAANAAEVAKKAAEEELKKNAPGPDADKAPLKFTDAVDRSFTLPWHLVKSWKGMETLIRQAFVNIERIGPHVANGHYHLLGPNGEIILPQVWDIIVQPGWDIKMQMWPLPPDPLEEKVNSGIGGFPPDIQPVPDRVPRGSRPRHQVSGNKSAGKRASVGPAPPPPPPAPVQHASPLSPPIHVPSVTIGHDDLDDPVVEIIEDSPGRGRGGSGGDGHKLKSSANSSKKKQVPAFTRWMLGGGTRPRPKGAEKPAAGVKIRQVVI